MNQYFLEYKIITDYLLLRLYYPTQMSGNKKENAVPDETNDEMEPRRSGKSATQKARDLHRSAGT